MRYILSILWLALCGLWIKALFFHGSLVGGVEWLVHTRNTVPSALNIFMAILCLVALIILLMNKRFPIVLVYFISIAVGVHLINALYEYMLFSSNGRFIFSIIRWPFSFLHRLIPTYTLFTNKITGNFVIFILPFSTALLFGASLYIQNLKILKNDA
jgi:hypothetical protein